MFAKTILQAAGDAGRWRQALVIDLIAGTATVLVLDVIAVMQQALLGLFGLWRSELWHNLLFFSLWFGLFGAILTGHALLARRGQTVGLALMRLRWRTPAGQPTAHRLLGEPQLWCAAGPALYFVLLLALALPLSLSPALGLVGPWLFYVTGAVLIAGALAIMVAARRSPGQLVSYPLPAALQALYRPRAAHRDR